MVGIHKFGVYKVVSRPRVNESSEWSFIKVILTKDQERDRAERARRENREKRKGRTRDGDKDQREV